MKILRFLILVLGFFCLVYLMARFFPQTYNTIRHFIINSYNEAVKLFTDMFAFIKQVSA